MSPDSPLKKTLDAWLARRARNIRAPLGMAVAMGLAAGIVVIVQAALLAWILNAVIVRGATLVSVWPALCAILPSICLRFVAVEAAQRYAFAGAAKIRTALRGELIRKIQALGPAWLANESSGALSSHLVAGVEALEGYFARWLPQRALSALLPLAFVVAIFPVDWVSGLVLVLSAPLIPIFMTLLGKDAVAANQRQWRRLARLSAPYVASSRRA